MSYTPDEQIFEGHARAALENLREVRGAMLARISSGSYKDEHCEKLGAAIATITTLEIQLALLEVT